MYTVLCQYSDGRYSDGRYYDECFQSRLEEQCKLSSAEYQQKHPN